MLTIEEFYSFMKEREAIRLRRLHGDSFPWTDDPILQRYKFTNVKRAHDKTSTLLREEFYEPHRYSDRREILLNCTIARYFGTIEFMRALGWQSRFNPELIKGLARRRLENRERVFTGAYVITNQGISAPKQDVVVDIFLSGVWGVSSELFSIADKTNSWRSLIEKLRCVQGFGGSGFMAKEVVLDTMFTGFWGNGVPKDFNTWCPAGPGARRGINRILGIHHDKSMGEEYALDIMLDIFDRRHRYWPEDYIELELHDIQFQLCEFDKYLRVKNNQGRPRNKYHHRQE